MDKEVLKMVIALLMSNLQSTANDINSAIQKKLMSRWGLNSNQIIRQRNALSTEIVEQASQLSMILKSGLEPEKPVNFTDMLTKMVGQAPQPDVLDAPPGWKKDEAGNWIEV